MIRPVVPDEAAHISELAVRSKAYWGYDAAFVGAMRLRDVESDVQPGRMLPLLHYTLNS